MSEEEYRKKELTSLTRMIMWFSGQIFAYHSKYCCCMDRPPDNLNINTHLLRKNLKTSVRGTTIGV